jgi:hypothetical protein
LVTEVISLERFLKLDTMFLHEERTCETYPLAISWTPLEGTLPPVELVDAVCPVR